MSEANKRQVGGGHYKGAQCPHCGESLEHWDLAWLFRWDNFQYAITKYVMRWREKAGLRDLEKAAHCLEKYMEVVAAEDPELMTPNADRMRVEVAKPGDLDATGRRNIPREEWLDAQQPEDPDAEPGPGYVNQDPDLKHYCGRERCPGHATPAGVCAPPVA